MPYELAHDTIARQVYEKASTEARTRRKVERYVREHYLAYEERAVQLTQDDIDYIDPYLASINIEPEELALIDKAKAGLKRSRRRRRITVAAIIAVLSLTTVLAVVQGQNAIRSETQAKESLEISKQAEQSALQQKNLAEQAREEADQLAIAEGEAREDAVKAGERANTAAERAERDRLIAVKAQEEAEDAITRAIRARVRADELAESESVARDEARLQAAQAIIEKERAEAFEQQALKQANTSRLSAYAIQQSASNPTIALRLAYEACKASDFQDELAVTTFHQLVDNPENCFYQLDFSQHPGNLLSLAFSPDAKLALSGDVDGHVYLWQTADGKVLEHWTEHQLAVRAVEFTPDGQYALTASDDGTVLIRDLATAKIIRTFSFGRALKAARFISGGQSVVAVGDNERAKRWRVADGQSLACAIRHRGAIWGLDVSRDGQYLITSDEKGDLKLWDGSGEKLLASKSGSNTSIRTVAFAPDGKAVAAGDLSGKIQTWSLPRLRPSGVWQEAGSEIWDLAYAPQGDRLVSTDNNADIVIWDTRTKTPTAKLKGHNEKVFGLQFSTDGRYLLTGGSDERCLLWDVQLWQRQMRLLERSNYTREVEFSSDGQSIVTGGYDHELRIWNRSSTNTWLGPIIKTGHEGVIRDIVLPPNTTYCISVDKRGKVMVWDRLTREVLASFTVAPIEVEEIAVSPSGRWLAVAHTDHTIELWDIPSRKAVKRMEKQHSQAVSQMLFSPDEQSLFSADASGVVARWSVTSQNFVQQIGDPSASVGCLSIKPDGTALLIGYDSGKLHWHKLQDGALISVDTLNSSGIYSLAFSPSGDQLFVGFKENKAQLMNVAGREVVQTFILPLEPDEVRPMDACFNPQNSREIIIGGWDGNGWILQNMSFMLETGGQIAPLPPDAKYTIN